MKLTAENESAHDDLTDQLQHVSEVHVYPIQSETILTRHGSCPHCNEETTEIRMLRLLAVIVAIIGISQIASELGFEILGLVGGLIALAMFVVPSVYAGVLHRVLGGDDR